MKAGGWYLPPGLGYTGEIHFHQGGMGEGCY